MSNRVSHGRVLTLGHSTSTSKYTGGIKVHMSRENGNVLMKAVGVVPYLRYSEDWDTEDFESTTYHYNYKKIEPCHILPFIIVVVVIVVHRPFTTNPCMNLNTVLCFPRCWFNR